MYCSFNTYDISLLQKHSVIVNQKVTFDLFTAIYGRINLKMKKKETFKQSKIQTFLKKTHVSEGIREWHKVLKNVFVNANAIFSIGNRFYFVFVAVAAQDDNFINIGPEARAVLSVPGDITPYNTLKNIQSQKLNLPSEYRFPLRDNRKFNQKWLEEFVWLEYSLSKMSLSSNVSQNNVIVSFA